MRSTFWPNRICQGQSCQNRHTGLKFSSKRENSALFLKIVQNARFTSFAARFGQIEFVSVKVVKIVTLASNSLQNGETVRFSCKLYKTLLSGHAEHVFAKSHLWASKLSKSSHWPQILFKTEKQCAFLGNCTKRCFQVIRSTLFPFLREFQTSVTILRTLTLKNAIWPKHVAHDLKTAFCPIFMESALFPVFKRI